MNTQDQYRWTAHLTKQELDLIEHFRRISPECQSIAADMLYTCAKKIDSPDNVALLISARK